MLRVSHFQLQIRTETRSSAGAESGCPGKEGIMGRDQTARGTLKWEMKQTPGNSIRGSQDRGRFYSFLVFRVGSLIVFSG